MWARLPTRRKRRVGPVFAYIFQVIVKVGQTSESTSDSFDKELFAHVLQSGGADSTPRAIVVLEDLEPDLDEHNRCLQGGGSRLDWNTMYVPQWPLSGLSSRN